MRVVVCGSRKYNDRQRIFDVLRESITENDTIIEGCASGVDTIAGDYAKINHITLEEYPARWDLYGRAAGPKRNAEMLSNCDKAIIFWDGSSKGTKNDIDYCHKHNIKYDLYDAGGQN